MQHRGWLSVVAGSLILSNLSSLLGLILLACFDGDMSNISSSLFKNSLIFLKLALSIAIQTFAILLGSM
jgi:hypothetical protein